MTTRMGRDPVYWPGICPGCQTRGLEGHYGRHRDYLLCPRCGWASSPPMGDTVGLTPDVTEDHATV